MMFEIEYYSKKNGEQPAETFIREQETKLRAKLFRHMELLEEHGKDLREPYSSNLTDGIFELRVIQGNNIARVLYFFVIGKKIILTHGFVKKTRKTLQSEIELAKKYRADYMKRKEG